jgi:hypothetical protein
MFGNGRSRGSTIGGSICNTARNKGASGSFDSDQVSHAWGML